MDSTPFRVQRPFLWDPRSRRTRSSLCRLASTIRGQQHYWKICRGPCMGNLSPSWSPFCSIRTVPGRLVPIFQFPITVQNDISKSLSHSRQASHALPNLIKPLLSKFTQRKVCDPVVGHPSSLSQNPLEPPKHLQHVSSHQPSPSVPSH